MAIRKATITDGKGIRELLQQLGYPNTEDAIKNKLERLLASSSDEVIVYENEGKVVGFLSLIYKIELAFDKDFCEIGYFVVDENARSQNIGKQLEEYACQRAKERNCGLMQVFSLEKRTDAHRFYERQGYKHMEKFFEKDI